MPSRLETKAITPPPLPVRGGKRVDGSVGWDFSVGKDIVVGADEPCAFVGANGCAVAGRGVCTSRVTAGATGVLVGLGVTVGAGDCVALVQPPSKNTRRIRENSFLWRFISYPPFLDVNLKQR